MSMKFLGPLGPLGLGMLLSMPEPKHINQVDRAVSQHILTQVKEKVKHERNWFDPATMTPWMEDYYYGRKMR